MGIEKETVAVVQFSGSDIPSLIRALEVAKVESKAMWDQGSEYRATATWCADTLRTIAGEAE